MNWTEEQLQAIHKEGSNIIISAGAGSGKTAVLSERVLRKIKDGISVQQLLILTFTKAAANEMKQRIQQKLIKNNYLEEADKIDAAYITTFDSYALSIVKRYHYLLNISKNIKTIDPNLTILKKEELLDQILEKFYHDNHPQFLKLIDQFCVKDDTEIKQSILEISDKLDLRYDKEEYLKHYIKHYDSKIDQWTNEYCLILLNKITQIKIELSKLRDLLDISYIDKLEQVLLPLIEAKTYVDIKNNIEVKLPNLPKGCEESVKEIKDHIREIIKEIKEMAKYEDTLKMKQELLLTKESAEVICEIILELTEQLKQYKIQENQFEFIDISKMAIEILEKNPEIQEELKESYQEILLDEYQDTNDLQEKFISMIANNNVYMVGDIKQSIYRFRNANPYIFQTKYDQYSKGIDGIKIDLNQNFRSRKEVLNNINLIFNSIMDQTIGAADYKTAHQMIYGNKMYEKDGIQNQNHNFQILKYDYDPKEKYSKEEIEIFTIAQDIQNKINIGYQIFDKDQNKKRNILYQDCVILMDRATNFALYKKIFEYLNIPLTIYQDESMTNKNDINIIKNIMNLIVKQKQNQLDELYQYSYISVARSYLFQLTDQEIFQTIKEKTYEDTIIYQKIKKMILKMNQYNLKQFMEEIINEFQFYEKLITVGDIESSIIGLDYLLDLSNELGNQGYDLYTFTEYLNQIIDKKYEIKYSLDKNRGDSVKIMTIHGSKGLEFPICYYSGLYKTFNIDEIKGNFHYDNQYGIILPIFQEGIDSTILLTLFKQKYMKEEISEKIRLFYVSLTRTQEKMILILPNHSDSALLEEIVPDFVRLKYRSFADMLNSISNILSPYIETISTKELKMTKNYNLAKKMNYQEKIEYTDEIINIKNIKLPSTTKRNQTFSKKTLTLYNKKQYENIKKGLKEHEKMEYQSISKNNLIQKHFKELPLKIYREYEFMYEEKGVVYHGIIDLILEYKDNIKIIDYKLKNINDQEYISQLLGYQKYLEKLTSKSIEIYLYSILTDDLKKLEKVGI